MPILEKQDPRTSGVQYMCSHLRSVKLNSGHCSQGGPPLGCCGGSSLCMLIECFERDSMLVLL